MKSKVGKDGSGEDAGKVGRSCVGIEKQEVKWELSKSALLWEESAVIVPFVRRC